ncbi:MAG: single-stranded-DNA-specific exonuclease RecJ [Marinilabiliales bacterium]|nr:MAG: single-stranded-DNA-specific exonuclease RecJ [Marinilabiliales bacterium]
METKWLIKENGHKDEIEKISKELNVDRIIAKLLVQRDIKTYEQAEAYFRPNLSMLHDPFEMKDMDKAVERLASAMNANENILIYGDYDVDGTSAVSMMYSFLKTKNENISFYIPDRYEEGYGLSIKGIDYAFENNCKLIITLDCGIKAIEKVEYANTLDIDIIVCDHHNPDTIIPDAVAVLDPKREDCNYPYKDLSGCGVGFKLLQAYTLREQYELMEESQIAKELYPFLDLVAISIASDIVPITNENRILSFYGLKQINTNPRPGIMAINQLTGIDRKEIEINDIVFKIGPRVNAAGRIESGQKSVDLLTSENPETAEAIASEVEEYNTTRKDLDQKITEEALSMINSDEELQNKKSNVLFNPEWHKGVVGIVASRVIEKYYKPTIILTLSNGLVTGSARSVAGFDIYKAIETCSDLLENFGGHTYAAGISLTEENLPLFIDKFESTVAESIQPESLVQQIEIDSFLKLSSITPKFFRILKQFRPFGPQNMKPVFVTKNVIDSGRGKMVGKDNDHLRLELKENIASRRPYQAIAFKQARHYEDIKYRKPFDICYSIEENEYKGTKSLQLKVRDIKPVSDF